MALQALRGTTDVLGDEVTRWSMVEHTAKHLAHLYGYQELRTPLIEDAALFRRSIGETTDIIQKEMFRFEDRGGHDIVLRPEGTASIVRAYLEHNLHKTQGFAKLCYLGPMFRAERPQAGRFRQFHQFGVEAIGSMSPWVDVESMLLCVHILRACGVKDTTVWLTSMGCRDDQKLSANTLRVKLLPHKAQLDQQCQARFDRNVFRVLDCKNPSCQAIVTEVLATAKGGVTKGSPFVVCEACEQHLGEVRTGLTEAGVSYDDTKIFARGLDYYTRTVFEVRAKGLGAQDAVAAGGRYDHLVEELGGPPLGAIGWAAGIERLLIAAEQGRLSEPATPARRGLYLAIAQPALVDQGFRLIQQCREQRVRAVMDFDGKSLKAQLREADKSGCRLVAILGEAELQHRTITVKDLEQGSQRPVALEAFVADVSQQLNAPAHCQ